MVSMINVPDVYKPLYLTKKPIILITGGRGSGKSFNSNLFIKRLSYESGHVILHTRYTMTSAEKSVIPEFKEKIDLEEDHKYFRVTNTEITNLASDSRIMFSGIKTSSGNQTANLKSIQGLTTFVVDEAEEWVSEDEFDKIRLSIRTKGIQNRVVIVMNPSNVEHWVYKRFIENTNKIVNIDGVDIEISTHPDVEHIHTTYLDNIEHLSDTFIKDVKTIKEEEPDKYAKIIIGAWARQSEGVLFAKDRLRYFNPNEISVPFETSFAFGDIADEGTDATCFPFGRNIGTNIYITDVVFSKLLDDVTIPLVCNAAKEQKTTFILCESNNMGAMYARNLRAQIHKGCDVDWKRTTTNKHTRIMTEANTILKHCVFVEPQYQSEPYRQFMAELIKYNIDPKLNKNIHDDAPDSLVGLIQLIKYYLQHLYY
jgi:PBSX family phage terminase large subunit